MRKKVSVFVALAPVMRLDHTTNAFFLSLGKDIDKIQWWLDALSIDELFGPGWLVA